jgi:hypothetical protein
MKHCAPRDPHMCPAETHEMPFYAEIRRRVSLASLPSWHRPHYQTLVSESVIPLDRLPVDDVQAGGSTA